MFQRDYILRLIEEMGQALALIVQLRREGRYQEALATIDETMGRLVGLGLAEADAMPAENFVNLLRFIWSEPSANTVVADRFIVLARLLEEAGDVAATEGYTVYRDLRRLKALQLYLAVLAEDDPDSADAARAVEPLLGQLSEYDLPPTTQERLWGYFEQRGDFASAEDWLFGLLRGDAGDSIIEQGVAFYERLLEQSDAVLDAGNLPREEVLAGLAELQEMQAARRLPDAERG